MSRFRMAAAAVVSLLVFAPAITAAAATPAAAPRPATGKQLAGALLPPSAFGPGLSVLKNSSFNSGGTLERGPARYKLATVSCAAYFSATTGFGETATAGNTPGNVHIGYSQAVYQFATAAAATAFMHGSYGVFARCRSYTTSAVNVTFRTTTQALRTGLAGKYAAFTADQTVTITVAGHAPSTNRFHFLYVQAGTDVFSMVPTSFTAAAPASSKAMPLVFALIARVRAL